MTASDRSVSDRTVSGPAASGPVAFEVACASEVA